MGNVWTWHLSLCVPQHTFISIRFHLVNILIVGTNLKISVVVLLYWSEYLCVGECVYSMTSGTHPVWLIYLIDVLYLYHQGSCSVINEELFDSNNYKQQRKDSFHFTAFSQQYTIKQTLFVQSELQWILPYMLLISKYELGIFLLIAYWFEPRVQLLTTKRPQFICSITFFFHSYCLKTCTRGQKSRFVECPPQSGV